MMHLLFHIERFKPNTPIITKISTRAGRAEQNENIHQYKLQSHTSKAKYPIATAAVAWAIIESNATDDENIVSPERNPTYSIQSNPMATASPAVSSMFFLEKSSEGASTGRHALTFSSGERRSVKHSIRCTVMTMNL